MRFMSNARARAAISDQNHCLLNEHWMALNADIATPLVTLEPRAVPQDTIAFDKALLSRTNCEPDRTKYLSWIQMEPAVFYTVSLKAKLFHYLHCFHIEV